jgi:hydrogenase maturation protease
MKKVGIIGYGSDIRSDDAVGLLLSRELEEHFKDNEQINCYEGLTSVDMVELFKEYEHLFILDAAFLKEGPGAVKKQPIDAMTFKEDMSFSHNTNFGYIVPLAKEMDYPIPKITFYMIEPKNLDMGETLTPKVAEGMKKLKEMILKDIKELD